MDQKTTKENIFEKAVDLFSQKGFHAVSVRELTREVGIKESSLYNHYRSKEEILEAIFDYFKSRMEETSFSEEHLTLIDELTPEAFFRTNLQRFAKNLSPEMVKIWRIIFMEQFRIQRAREFILEEMIHKPIDFYEKALSRMVEKELIRTADVKNLAMEYNAVLLALSIEFSILMYDNKDTAPIVKQMFDHIHFFCERIG